MAASPESAKMGALPSPEGITESSWQGYIASTHDALLLFEAARRGHVPKIRRRLKEEERKNLIRSGAVFVFEEKESGIKRWTDGLLWSPSRILQNFLVYRQIDRKVSNNSSPKGSTPPEQSGFPIGQEPEISGLAAGMPRIVPNPAFPPQQGEASGSRTAPAHMTSSPSSSSVHGAAAIAAMNGRDRSGSLDSNLDMISPDGQRIAMARKGAPPMFRRNSDLHRSLVGSLTSSYPFVEKGLCKKTISLEVQGNHHHLISYYSLEDVYSGKLRTPSSLPELLSLPISPMFLARSNFRAPPNIEIDQDGVPYYRGEAEDPGPNAHVPASLVEAAESSRASNRRGSRARAASAASATMSSKQRVVSDGSDSSSGRMPHEIGGSGLLPFTPSTTMSYTGRTSSFGRYEPYPSGVPQSYNSSPSLQQHGFSPQVSVYQPSPDNSLMSIEARNYMDGTDSRPMTAQSAPSVTHHHTSSQSAPQQHPQQSFSHHPPSQLELQLQNHPHHSEGHPHHQQLHPHHQHQQFVDMGAGRFEPLPPNAPYVLAGAMPFEADGRRSASDMEFYGGLRQPGLPTYPPTPTEPVYAGRFPVEEEVPADFGGYERFAPLMGVHEQPFEHPQAHEQHTFPIASHTDPAHMMYAPETHVMPHSMHHPAQESSSFIPSRSLQADFKPHSASNQRGNSSTPFKLEKIVLKHPGQ